MAKGRFVKKYFSSSRSKYLKRGKKARGRQISKMRGRKSRRVKRMVFRRKTPTVRVSAPATTTASTFYNGSRKKNAGMLARRYKAAARNIYTWINNARVASGTGAQGYVDTF